MSLIDCILNLAGLLLWLNWLSPRLDPLARTAAASLAGTLSRAETVRPQRWQPLVWLFGLLVVRGYAYSRIGPVVEWTPHLELGVIALSFRTYAWQQMYLFSALSFGLTLVSFYLWLLFISLVNTKVPDKDAWQKLVRVYLGWVERPPWPLKCVVPPVVAGAGWFALHPLFAYLKLMPHATDGDQIAIQALVFAGSSYLVWKYLIVAILVLHTLNTYVYLGNNPFWLFLNQTARNVLWPLSWLPLRLGKMDFTPLLAIALVFLLADFAAPIAYAWLAARFKL